MHRQFEEFLGQPAFSVPAVSWDEIEAELELTLPEDYKSWADRYRTIRIAEYLIIENLRCLIDREAIGSFRARAAGPFGYVRDTIRRNPSSPLRTIDGLFPYQAEALKFYPENSGLIYVGLGDNNEIVGLLPPGDGHDACQIVVADAREWWIFNGPFGEFLEGIVTGVVECNLFPWLSDKPVVLEELVAYESTGGGVIPNWRLIP